MFPWSSRHPLPSNFIENERIKIVWYHKYCNCQGQPCHLSTMNREQSQLRFPDSGSDWTWNLDEGWSVKLHRESDKCSALITPELPGNSMGLPNEIIQAEKKGEAQWSGETSPPGHSIRGIWRANLKWNLDRDHNPHPTQTSSSTILIHVSLTFTPFCSIKIS